MPIHLRMQKGELKNWRL